MPWKMIIRFVSLDRMALGKEAALGFDLCLKGPDDI